MLIAKGDVTRKLSIAKVKEALSESLDSLPIAAKRVLVIIPDNTRTAPMPMIFSLLYEIIGRKVRQLDYLIALGTHPPMSEQEIDKLVGVSSAERKERYPNVKISNHQWNDPDALTIIGVISQDEMGELSQGLLLKETPVQLNKSILDYDLLLVCGPVFPHEVVGFSGGAKYLFPGIAGAEIINMTHWLGALVTSMKTIGVKDTPVRRVIHKAASMVKQPVLCIALCLQEKNLHGIYIGSTTEAWNAAADLSARLNILEIPHPFHTVLSMPADIYDELWTAAKAMYKTEPVVVDGGEIIIYAPHLIEISRTHGTIIKLIGYHVRDYFIKQWDHFVDVPLSVLAHSTHLRGSGTYENGIEHPRINVTLATGIPKDVCRQINLGYRNPSSIKPQTYIGKEDKGVLMIPHAGEQLYRLKGN
jgi:nickel-dependent lactate racemase